MAGQALREKANAVLPANDGTAIQLEVDGACIPSSTCSTGEMAIYNAAATGEGLQNDAVRVVGLGLNRTIDDGVDVSAIAGIVAVQAIVGCACLPVE